MTAPARFLLDSDVLIQAHRMYYAFDLCPGFWAALVAHHGQNRLLSIDRVKAELDRGNDDLKDWASKVLPAAFFATTLDSAVGEAFGRAQVWVESQPQYLQAAKAEFAQAVDGWLAAYASVHGLVVVTQEEPAPASRKRVKLPDVCLALGVRCVNTFAMLRELGISFRWP